MDIDNRKILIAIGAITLLLFPVVAFTTGALRIALGLPFILFFPGYALLSALFPKRDSLDVIERVALSFGLSIAVVPLIGLVLNYTPWGIKLYPILISTTLFVVVTAAIAYYRQQKLPEANRPRFAFGVRYLFRAIVTDIISEPDAVKVKIDSQGQETIYKARVAIIATGFGSVLPRQLSLGEIKHFVLGAQAEVDINGVDGVEVYFDQSLAPGGFAWLVPTREGKGLAGLLTRHQPDSYLRNFLNTLSSHGKLTSTEVVPRYGIIPL